MKRNPLLLVFILGTISLFSGCKHRALQSLHLRSLTSYLDYQKTQQGITLRVKRLCAQDCTSLLGEHAHRLFKKHRRRQPIYPIQISITNNTHTLAALDPKNIDLTLTDYHSVANRLHRNSFVQAFGGLVAGILVTGLLAASSIFALSASGMLLVIIGSMKALAPIAICGGAALLITPFFLVIGTPVVSTIKGVQTTQQNRLLKKEIKNHALKHALIIEPRETIDTLIFVEKRNYQEQFSITLANPENAQERIPFLVKLRNHTF